MYIRPTAVVGPKYRRERKCCRTKVTLPTLKRPKNVLYYDEHTYIFDNIFDSDFIYNFKKSFSFKIL